jgi:hypothetical protein
VTVHDALSRHIMSENQPKLLGFIVEHEKELGLADVEVRH